MPVEAAASAVKYMDNITIHMTAKLSCQKKATAQQSIDTANSSDDTYSCIYTHTHTLLNSSSIVSFVLYIHSDSLDASSSEAIKYSKGSGC